MSLQLLSCRTWWCVAVLVLGNGCTGPAPEEGLGQPAIDTLPSGAVRTVNHAPTEWRDTNGWHLQLERRITSASTGPAFFADPTGLVATSTGDIVILDRHPASLKLFSPTGEFLRIIGREGAGPGEYADFGDLGIVADTLVVNDRRHARLVLFTTAGALLRTVAGDRGPMVQPATNDGRIALFTYHLAQRQSTPADNYAGEGVRRYRTDGTVTDSIFYPPEPLGKLWTLVDASHDLGAFIPFTPEYVVRFDNEGHLLWGDQARYRLIVSATGADTLRIIEADAPQFPIADSLRQAALNDVLTESPWTLGIAQLADIPTSYPLWTDLRSDRLGNIWVLRPGPDGPGSTLDVFTPSGVLRGQVAAPFSSLDRSFWTEDHVYRIGESESGEPLIEVWQIVKPAGAALEP